MMRLRARGRPADGGPPRWRREFPYRQDADDLVSRREFLRFTVLGSAALFAGTVVLAALGTLTGRRRGTPVPLVRADAVAPGEAVYFEYPGPGDQAVLINTGSGFVAYSQKCTHLACAVYYQREQGRLFCPCHDGVFALETGEPVAGPPQRRLPRIRLEERDGMIYALEETP